MKALIVLLAVVALSYADDACFEQAHKLQQCVCDDLKDNGPKTMDVLKKFGGEIGECFKKADGCELPKMDHPAGPPGPLFPMCPGPHPQGPPPNADGNSKFDPAAAAAFNSCITAVGASFVGCVEEKAGVKLPQLPGGPGAFHGGFGGPPGQQGGPGLQNIHDKLFNGGNFNKSEIDNFLSKICPDNKASRGVLLKCALGVVAKDEYLPTLFGVVAPEFVLCKAAGKCNQAPNAISSDCVPQLEKVRQAACTCKSDVEASATNNKDCAALAELGKRGPPPAGPFDICNDGPEKKCADANKKFEEIKKLLAQGSAMIQGGAARPSQ